MPSWMPLFQELSRTRGTNLINSIFGESIGCFMIHTVDRVQRFRSLTSQKCSEWKKYLSVTVFVAVATLLGLLIAIANLPPAIQTNDLARWTAKKDFWEWCANEEASNHTISLECQSALGQPLRPPPTTRFVHDVQPTVPSLILRYRPSHHTALILKRLWRAGMVALVIVIVICFSLLYITGVIRRERYSARRPTDPESLVGFTRRADEKRARFASQDVTSRTAFSSNVGLKALPASMRSRKRSPLQYNGGRSDVLKDFEKRFLEAEREKAETRFEVKEDANLFCADGKFFSMTLRKIQPPDGINLKRSPTV